MDFIAILSGFGVGAIVGMTGVGGGSLMTPLLVLVFGFKPTVAIGTDIVHGAIFKSFGAIQHRRLGHVHARLTGWMLLGSAPFSIAGVALAWWLHKTYGDGYEDTAKAILGVALVLCGFGFLVKTFLHTAPEDKPLLLQRRDRIAVATECGLQNAGLGIFIAASVMQSPAMTVPSVVYALLMNFGAIGFVILMRGRERNFAGGRTDAAVR